MSREAIEQTIKEATMWVRIDDREYAAMIEDVTNAIIEKCGGEEHIVYVDDDGMYTMQHPVSERFEHKGLWECQFLRLVDVAYKQGAFTAKHTKHRVWLDRGALMWEEVEP